MGQHVTQCFRDPGIEWLAFEIDDTGDAAHSLCSPIPALDTPRVP